MSANIPLVVFVGGDPVLGMDNIVSLKATWKKLSPGLRCVDIVISADKNIPKMLNALDGEVATQDWDDAHKVVVLRGLSGLKGFRESLMQIMQNVASGNTLVIYDETGVVKQDATWKPFYDLVEKMGFVAKVPKVFSQFDKIPFGHKVGPQHIKKVVDSLASRGKKITDTTVENVFFELVPLDWSYIKGELDKLVELSKGEHITPEEVRRIVFPCTPGHAIYEFSEAFNSGMPDRILEKYDELIESGLENEVIFSSATKLLRWQMIAGHLLSYGAPLPQSLEALGGLMLVRKAEAKTAKLRSMKPHLFKREGKVRTRQVEKMLKDEVSAPFGITSFVAKGASHFVKEVMPKRVPIKSGNLGSFPFMIELMRRYLLMVNCIETVRREGADTARKTFRETVLKICRRES